jgi:hypothetical protein
MKTLITILVLAIGGMSFADEPGWTPEQRAEHRQAVVDAIVTKIEKVRNQPAKKAELMRAVLKVTGIHKGKDLVGASDAIEIFYESSSLGANYRCPTFPVLKPKQHGRFYLRFDAGLSEQKAFVLEMGSDFAPIPLDARKVIPELTKALRGSPTFDELSQILGEPHLDIGSGIHVFVYTLDEGASVTVGTSDRKKTLYVNQGAERLYPTKAEQSGAANPAKPGGRP